MNFFFIIDTSPSMLQTPLPNYSILTLAKNAVEHLIKSRSKYQESKFDSYHLMNTCKMQNLKATWEDDLNHLTYQVKNMTFTTYNFNIFSLLLTFLNVVFIFYFFRG